MATFGRLRALGFGLLVGLLSACGTEPEEKEPVGDSTAEILEFRAEPARILEGESATLRWSTRGAVAIVLHEGGLLLAEELPPEGRLVVRPPSDTRYRLEARDGKGRSIEAELVVEVESEARGAPRIETFLVSPPVVEKGIPAELVWKVVDADTLEILADPGGRIATPMEAAGSLVVQPTTTTRYALRARNEAGLSTAEAVVTVGNRPTVELELSRDRVVYGDEVTLRWTVTDAEVLRITGPDGSAIYEGPAEDGSMAVEALRSGSFLAVAEGPGGEAEASVLLEVEPWIESFTVVSQGEARPGNPALVSWKVWGADRVVIANEFGELWETDAAEGSRTVPVPAGGNIVLRAHAGSLVAEKRVVVQVVETPLIRLLSHGPLVTAGRGVVGASTIGWEVDGATHVKLAIEPGGEVDLTGKSPLRDEVMILFEEPGTVSLTAFNAAGSVTKTIPSPVVPVPTITTFVAAPSRVAPGDPVELHWEVLDAERVVLEQAGVALPVDESLVRGYHRTAFPLQEPTSFLLRATNSLGHPVSSGPLAVELGPPEQLVFDTADGERIHDVGSTVGLRWENEGGTELEIKDARTGAILCSSSSWVGIRSGGCDVVLPSEQGEFPLVLEVASASGVDTRNLDLFAAMGPIVLAFTADADAITEGESVLFSWKTRRDSQGNLPALRLEDDRGQVYPLGDVVGEAVLSGSRSFPVFEPGPRVFTLTALTDLPPDHSASTAVSVHGVPQVIEYEVSPSFVEKEGDAVVVSWRTTHGASLELLLLSEAGAPASTPFFSTSDADVVAMGSALAHPTAVEPRIRLRVRNALGVESTVDVQVEVGGPGKGH